MIVEVKSELIPGTVLPRAKMGNVTGMEFLQKIFYISDGIMLSQIREISGVDGTTLQNWVKRGWVVNPQFKTYNIDQLARILIINMLRSSIQLGKISFMLQYINGDTESMEDDILPESRLYDYICRIIASLEEKRVNGGVRNGDIAEAVRDITADYEERIPGARERLTLALEIIVISYYASTLTSYADGLIDGVRLENEAIADL